VLLWSCDSQSFSGGALLWWSYTVGDTAQVLCCIYRCPGGLHVRTAINQATFPLRLASLLINNYSFLLTVISINLLMLLRPPLARLLSFIALMLDRNPTTNLSNIPITICRCFIIRPPLTETNLRTLYVVHCKRKQSRGGAVPCSSARAAVFCTRRHAVGELVWWMVRVHLTCDRLPQRRGAKSAKLRRASGWSRVDWLTGITLPLGSSFLDIAVGYTTP